MPEGAAATIPSPVLGFDFGLKRIGIAVGQSVTGTASAVAVLNQESKSLFNEIKALVGEWRPQSLVVGLPLAMSGDETDMSRLSRKFAGRLHGEFGLPVYFHDERLSSVAAEQTFADMRASGQARRSQRGLQDALAARVMLESWLADAAQSPPISALGGKGE